MTRSASMCCSTPSPPQAGQAPNGLLNENSRGSISGMVKPDTGQANFSEKIRRSGPLWSWILARFLCGRLPCERRRARRRIRPPPGRRRACSAVSNAFREPRRDVGPHHDAVDHHVDVVLELLVERRRVGDLVELAVDLHALEAALHEVGELLAVLALAAAHHRRQQIEPRALGQRHHPVDHLRHGLAFDRQAGRGRIGHADARPQQPHVVVDLGDGADGRARVVRGGLLLDRDGGREAVDLVDVRLLHHLQELARIGRERFDVAALALGIDGVEGERGFARARQAGEHHQLVARDFDVDVLEIVLARAADRDHAGAVGDPWRRGRLLSNRSFMRSVGAVRSARARKSRRSLSRADFWNVVRTRRLSLVQPAAGRPFATRAAVDNPPREDEKLRTATMPRKDGQD